MTVKKWAGLLTLVLSLMMVPVASSSTAGPVRCFKAHHWIVRGTNMHGKAWPRPKNRLRYEQWKFYAPGRPAFTLNVGLNHKQLRIAKLCMK